LYRPLKFRTGIKILYKKSLDMQVLSVLLSCTVLLASLSSCKKESSPDPTTTTSTTWSVDGKSYSVNRIDRNTAGSIFMLVVNADNYIQVAFPAIPTVSGAYKVVSASNTPAGNEISVILGVGSSLSTDNYASTGTDNISATVTVGTNGKLKVVIPAFEVLHVSSSGGTLSNTTASATLVE
jgi:hypothetical protein